MPCATPARGTVLCTLLHLLACVTAESVGDSVVPPLQSAVLDAVTSLPAPPPPAHLMFDAVLVVKYSDHQSPSAVRLDSQLVQYDMHLVTLWFQGLQRPGVVAHDRAQSHVSLLEYFYNQTTYRHVLILEEDAVFVADPRPNVTRFLTDRGPAGWDVLMLASETWSYRYYNDYALRVVEARSPVAYAVTRRMVPELLHGLRQSLATVSIEDTASMRSGAVIEHAWRQLQPHHRWFALATEAVKAEPLE